MSCFISEKRRHWEDHRKWKGMPPLLRFEQISSSSENILQIYLMCLRDDFISWALVSDEYVGRKQLNQWVTKKFLFSQLAQRWGKGGFQAVSQGGRQTQHVVPRKSWKEPSLIPSPWEGLWGLMQNSSWEHLLKECAQLMSVSKFKTTISHICQSRF